MNKLISESILKEIESGRVENGIVRNCLIALEQANRQVTREIKKTDSIYSKARYKEIRTYLKDVSKELKKNVDESMDIDEFLEYQLETQMKLMKKYGGVSMVAPSLEMLVSTSTFAPYTSTSTFATYLDSLETDYFSMWDSTVRSGYLTGMTTPQIVRKVMGYSAKGGQVAGAGLIHSLRNSVEMNTRTALQSYAMETRKLVYSKNEELFDGYRWVATLDRRTCLVCGNNEKKVYRNIKEIDVPPAHYNCRCTIVPIVKDMEELETDDTRASMNGQVDAKITFEEWLKEQSKEVQLDVLGKARYEMFQSGKSLGGFISDNRILTLEELKEK